MAIDILTLAAARAGGSGSGGGSTSKYAQPKWGKGAGLVDILPEATYTATEETDGMAAITEPVSLVVGNVYTVLYNGVAYNCTAYNTAFDEEGTVKMVALGNMGVDDPVNMTDPFVVMIAADQEIADMLGAYGILAPLDGSETFTLSIKCEGETIYKIPVEYYCCAMRVNVTEDTENSSRTADKTFDEIKGAIETGSLPFVVWYGYIDARLYILHLDKAVVMDNGKITQISFSTPDGKTSLNFIENGAIGITKVG